MLCRGNLKEKLWISCRKRSDSLEFLRTWRRVVALGITGLEGIWLRNVGWASDDNREQKIKFKMSQIQRQNPSSPNKCIPFFWTQFSLWVTQFYSLVVPLCLCFLCSVLDLPFFPLTCTPFPLLTLPYYGDTSEDSGQLYTQRHIINRLRHMELQWANISICWVSSWGCRNDLSLKLNLKGLKVLWLMCLFWDFVT